MPARLWPSLILALALQPGHAQAPAPPTSYDVISVHEHDPSDYGSSWRSNPDGMSMTGIPLKSLVAGAYGVKLELVSGGPAWVEDKRFDLVAKLLPTDDGRPVTLSDDQRELLFQKLLADRFHVQAHVETKQLPIYDLVLAKGGSRLKPSPPDSDTDDRASREQKHGSMVYPNRMVARGYNISSLAGQLGYMVHQTVINKTGLTGNYDFTLDYTPDEQLAHPASDSATDPKPDLFTALQEQLGLRLVPSKGPVRTLVIDHAELPTPN